MGAVGKVAGGETGGRGAGGGGGSFGGKGTSSGSGPGGCSWLRSRPDTLGTTESFASQFPLKAPRGPEALLVETVKDGSRSSSEALSSRSLSASHIYPASRECREEASFLRRLLGHFRARSPEGRPGSRSELSPGSPVAPLEPPLFRFPECFSRCSSRSGGWSDASFCRASRLAKLAMAKPSIKSSSSSSSSSASPLSGVRLLRPQSGRPFEGLRVLRTAGRPFPLAGLPGIRGRSSGRPVGGVKGLAGDSPRSQFPEASARLSVSLSRRWKRLPL